MAAAPASSQRDDPRVERAGGSAQPDEAHAGLDVVALAVPAVPDERVLAGGELAGRQRADVAARDVEQLELHVASLREPEAQSRARPRNGSGVGEARKSTDTAPSTPSAPSALAPMVGTLSGDASLQLPVPSRPRTQYVSAPDPTLAVASGAEACTVSAAERAGHGYAGARIQRCGADGVLGALADDAGSGLGIAERREQRRRPVLPQRDGAAAHAARDQHGGRISPPLREQIERSRGRRGRAECRRAVVGDQQSQRAPDSS